MNEISRIIREAWWLLLVMLVLFILSCLTDVSAVREVLWLASMRGVGL